MIEFELEYRIADLATLRELLSVFAVAFDDADSYLSAQPSDDHLRPVIERDDFIPLVAIEEGKVVGGLAAYVLQKFEQSVASYTFTILRWMRGTGGEESRPG